MAQAVKTKLALVGITTFPSRKDDPVWTDIKTAVIPALTIQEMIHLKNDLFPVQQSKLLVSCIVQRFVSVYVRCLLSLWFERSLLILDNEFFSPFVEIAPSKDLTKLISETKIGGFSFTVKACEELKAGAAGSREYFGRVVSKVIKLSLRHHDCGGRNKASVDSHKPYYVQRSDEFAGEQGIVTLGEIKVIADDADRKFSDEEVGQVLDFLKELMIKQGWRLWVYGFLTDGIRFEFFCCKRRSDGLVNFTRSGLFSKGSGWLRLSQLLQQSNEILGFTVIQITGWNLGSSLGSGGSASVFAVSSEGDESAVCKIFSGSRSVICHANEIRALEMMRGDPYTPKIVSQVMETNGEASFPVTIIAPLGEPLGVKGVRLPIHAFAPLVDTLQASHMLGLCHLDVCGDNILAVRETDGTGYRAVLIDWASSMKIEEIRAAEQFSTRELYYDVTKMGPSEDLTALVRSVFALTQCTFSPVKTAEELDCHMRYQWSWGTALDFAGAGNYEVVRQFFLTGRCDTADALADAFPESAKN